MTRKKEYPWRLTPDLPTNSMPRDPDWVNVSYPRDHELTDRQVRDIQRLKVRRFHVKRK